jgi:hypothetical protein
MVDNMEETVMSRVQVFRQDTVRTVKELMALV